MGGRGSAGKKPSGGGGGVMRGSEKQLTPSQIILYGKKPTWLEDDVVEIEPDYEKRFRK